MGSASSARDGRPRNTGTLIADRDRSHRYRMLLSAPPREPTLSETDSNNRHPLYRVNISHSTFSNISNTSTAPAVNARRRRGT